MSDAGWTQARLERRVDWAPGLATFVLDLPAPDFVAGQFLRVGVKVGEGEPLSRPYSMASAPGHPLEFFVVEVPEGELTPRLFALQPGEPVWVKSPAAGVFTLDKVPDADTLWMVCTGTGLGPFVSMLRQEQVWQRYRHVVLVHGAREAAQLAYSQELQALSSAHGGRLVRVNAVSRQSHPDALSGRITDALRDGRLERAAGRPLGPDTAQVMLCGNPAMIAEMQELLADRGMNRHRRRRPGHVTLERYW